MPVDNDDVRELGQLLRDGLFGITQEIAKTHGEINGRLKTVENELHSLTIRVAPVLKAFENDLTVRIAMLEDKSKSQEKKIETLETKYWAAVIGLIGAMGTAIWSLIQQQLG